MRTNYVLIDFENVHPKSLDLLRPEHFHLQVFLGPTNTKLPRPLVLAIQEFGPRAEYIELDVSGKNALDFHVAYYLGVFASKDPTGFFHVISKDTGFDPLVQHLKKQGIFCARSASIEEMPCIARPESNGNGAKSKTIAAQGATGPATAQDEWLKLVLDDLIKRKAAKPRTPKTLKSTMQARCGSEVSADQIEALYAALVERGHVRVEGTKLTYSLPTPS